MSDRVEMSITSITKGTFGPGASAGEDEILLDSGLSFPTTPGASKEKVDVRLIGDALVKTGFDICPICMRDVDLTKEHLPPDSVGGRVLTWTCADCNHGFGAFEIALTSRRLGRLDSASFSGEGVLGQRKVRDVRLVDKEDGKFVLSLIGPGIDEAIESILEGELLSAVLASVSESAFRIASLKQFYLASCIAAGEIPRSKWGSQVREELSSALASEDRREIELGPCAEELKICLAHGAVKPGIGIYRGELEDADGSKWTGFAFGSFAFIGRRAAED